ncbi:MAG TPA: hypothetical protein VKG26_14640 [Bacteroidia bacterium]|nr:hypothetical protein [Bacteroidia bacterium]
MLKEFNKNFGITPSLDKEKEAFVNRINHFLRDLRYQILNQTDYNSLFSTVCVQLGLNARKIIDDNSILNRRVVPELDELLPNDFINTLKLIAAVRRYFSNKIDMGEAIDANIEGFLDLATIDLGVTYKAGMFFPKGEDLLDKELIGYSLNSLEGFPNENKDLQNALENYRSGVKYGVIENCYRCLEGLARQVLKNNKTLIDNKVEIITSIGLSDNWKKILAHYIDYGNEYGRHASLKRHDFSEAEVEAFLYTTCTLIRLIVKIKKSAE